MTTIVFKSRDSRFGSRAMWPLSILYILALGINACEGWIDGYTSYALGDTRAVWAYSQLFVMGWFLFRSLYILPSGPRLDLEPDKLVIHEGKRVRELQWDQIHDWTLLAAGTLRFETSTGHHDVFLPHLKERDAALRALSDRIGRPGKLVFGLAPSNWVRADVAVIIFALLARLVATTTDAVFVFTVLACAVASVGLLGLLYRPQANEAHLAGLGLSPPFNVVIFFCLARTVHTAAGRLWLESLVFALFLATTVMYAGLLPRPRIDPSQPQTC